MKQTQVQHLIDERLQSSFASMTEDEAKKIFALFGIPIVEERRVTQADQVVEACREIGFPVVLKGMSKRILHKTDAGLVRVGLTREDQVLEAIEGLAPNEVWAPMDQVFFQA